VPPLVILPHVGACVGLTRPDDATRDGVQDGDPQPEREAAPEFRRVEVGPREGADLLAPVDGAEGTPRRRPQELPTCRRAGRAPRSRAPSGELLHDGGALALEAQRPQREVGL
jgi:hypothetical protein